MTSDPRYAALQLEQILATISRLEHRINERFPGSGLSRVAAQLHRIGEGTGEVLARARRPNWLVRTGVGGAILLVAVIAIVLAAYLRSLSLEVDNVSSFLQAVESAAQDAIFLAIAVYFLFTVEVRLKR